MAADSDPDPVTWHLDDRVFRVSLRAPPTNALSPPLIAGLHGALDEFDASRARVLVLESALEGFFAAGADIKLMSTATREEFASYGERLRGPLNRLARSERPSVAAIEGRALGGGLELAMAATLRVGSTAAVLGLPEAKLGLIPGAGGTQRLPRLVGRGRALDIMLTAREVDAGEGHAIGLLDRLAEPGAAGSTAVDLARTLTQRSGPALAEIMRAVDDADDVALAEGLAREADRVNGLFPGTEAQEGLQAFLHKRQPQYD